MALVAAIIATKILNVVLSPVLCTDKFKTIDEDTTSAFSVRF